VLSAGTWALKWWRAAAVCQLVIGRNESGLSMAWRCFAGFGQNCRGLDLIRTHLSLVERMYIRYWVAHHIHPSKSLISFSRTRR